MRTNTPILEPFSPKFLILKWAALIRALSVIQIMFSVIDTKVSALLPRCRKLENKEENAQNLFFEMTSRYEILMETENLIER